MLAIFCNFHNRANEFSLSVYSIDHKNCHVIKVIWVKKKLIDAKKQFKRVLWKGTGMFLKRILYIGTKLVIGKVFLESETQIMKTKIICVFLIS